MQITDFLDELIEVEAYVIIKVYDKTVFEGDLDNIDYNAEYADMEIRCMYVEDNALVMEVTNDRY